MFRSYFKGREDVYAVRGTNEAGKAPYFPKRQYLGKENGRMIWGANLPLTDEVVRAHLQDDRHPVTVGIYPLLLDETCWFLAIDFDKASWKDDSRAFMEVCRKFNVPAALERSRSGNGGHIWIFFIEPLPARTARMLGSTLLTYTIEQRHEVGLDSYDRMFPNQDTLPKGKRLGNLIALPFQREAGRQGNSLFIDENYKPYRDQWVFLSSLRKMGLQEIKAIIREAREQGGSIRIASTCTDGKNNTSADSMNLTTPPDSLIPWNSSSQNLSQLLQEPWPNKMRLILADMLYVEKSDLSSPQMNALIRTAAFQNPEFYKAQAVRLPTYNIPRVINCSEESSHYIALPRGCQETVEALLESQGVHIEIEDKRNCGNSITARFNGELRIEQVRAAKSLLQHNIGVLSAATAFGKTVIGAYILAARAVNTLILVDRTQLMDQWRERLSLFLDISPKEIGMYGGGKHKRTGHIDIALFQSIYVGKEVKEFVADYGHVIVDECHHISAVSFEQVMKKVRAKYVLGLTATLTRKDGKHPIVLMQCGPVRFKADPRTQAKIQPFRHLVVPRYTDFKLTESETDIPIQQLYDQLLKHEARNDLIFDDLLKSLDSGRSPILLTDRTSHLEYFANRLKGFAKNIIVMQGGMGKRQRVALQEQIRSIPTDAERVILATGRFVGEEFDDARLDTLFLVMPISWKGTLQQYAGRLHRFYETKREVQIYDYVDAEVPVLMRMYKKRLKGYHAMGYVEAGNKEEE
jgi:superfamily II DNA or RNA helicase